MLRPRKGLTLVELMVATVLMVILVGVITFVWMQSNKIFATTVHRLETYQRLRTVLDVMERDLANTTRTVNMEFFVDTDKSGHYDDSSTDTFWNVTYSGHSEVPDGTIEHFRTPRDPLDPLKVNAESEFGLEGFGPTVDASGNSVPYFYSPTILSPPPYKVGAGYTDNRFYYRDEVYVRTFANVDGVNRPCLVHYRLVQGQDGRSMLRRRIWYVNENNELIAPDPNGTPVKPATDRTSILASNVCGMKIGFFFKETTTEDVGQWYHVGDISDGTYSDANEDEPTLSRGKSLLEADRTRGFFDARKAPPIGLSVQHTDQFGVDEDRNAISFYYEGNARIEQTLKRPPVLRTLDDGPDLTAFPLRQDPTPNTPPRPIIADLDHYQLFDFPGVRSGDRFLVYDATDDDDDQVLGVTNKKAGNLFPPQIYTVDAIFSDASEVYVGVKFREQINFSREIKTWLGVEGQVTILPNDLVGSAYDAGPAPQVGTDPNDGDDGRTIIASFNVKYRVGFLPAAFLVRLAVDDRQNNAVLPMERVIRLLQQ